MKNLLILSLIIAFLIIITFCNNKDDFYIKHTVELQFNIDEKCNGSSVTIDNDKTYSKSDDGIKLRYVDDKLTMEVNPSDKCVFTSYTINEEIEKIKKDIHSENRNIDIGLNSNTKNIKLSVHFENGYKLTGYIYDYNDDNETKDDLTNDNFDPPRTYYADNEIITMIIKNYNDDSINNYNIIDISGDSEYFDDTDNSANNESEDYIRDIKLTIGDSDISEIELKIGVEKKARYTISVDEYNCFPTGCIDTISPQSVILNEGSEYTINMLPYGNDLPEQQEENLTNIYIITSENCSFTEYSINGNPIAEPDIIHVLQSDVNIEAIFDINNNSGDSGNLTIMNYTSNKYGLYFNDLPISIIEAHTTPSSPPEVIVDIPVSDYDEEVTLEVYLYSELLTNNIADIEAYKTYNLTLDPDNTITLPIID